MVCSTATFPTSATSWEMQNVINSELHILKRFFNYSIDLEWIESNPFRLIKALKIPIKERYFFSDNELNMILENAGKFKAFYEVLLYTGIRPTDCYKLAKKHLQSNFETDFVRKNNINLHTFRHTYAHNMLNKGVPKEVLQTLLGHRSIKTTEIYANWVRKEELERWV